MVVRQPNAPAAFTPGEIPGTHFQRLSRPQGTWFCRKEPRKKSQVTPPGIDPGTVRLVAQRLNHYVTPGPFCLYCTITLQCREQKTQNLLATIQFRTLAVPILLLAYSQDPDEAPPSPSAPKNL